MNTDINKYSILTSILVFLFWASSPVHVKAAQDKNSSDLFSALTSGKIDFSLRSRYEHVDDDRATEEADVSTIRTTLGYTSGTFHDASIRLLVQDVRTVGLDDFNDATGRPGARTQFAVVADPSDTDVLEGYFGFKGVPNTTIKLGRQIITDRGAPFHRFLGTVLWRQNWQNHDAISVQNTSLPDTTIKYAYSWNVNRIFTDEAIGAKANFDSDSHFINIKYEGLEPIKVEGYSYLLDFKNAAALSVNTYGIRLNGVKPITKNVMALYAVEYAHQNEAGNNPGNIDADYFLGELGTVFQVNDVLKSLTVKFDYELLEGNGGVDRFLTPLATGHAFQGWADRFLVTPGDGIKDLYFTGIAKAFGAKFIVVFHDLSSDKDNYDYGTELDVLAVKTFKKHYTVGVKYSSYDADKNATNLARNPSQAADVNKLWAWVQIKY
jgi:hypothetical protein